MAFHFKRNPVDLDKEQVLDYLHLYKTNQQTPSESYFKHTVYGLRYAYRLCGMDDIRLSLPSIAQPKRLPVVLSQEEIKLLLVAPVSLKHRLVLAMLYGGGLRCFELRNLRVRDVDFYRKTVYVHEGKGRKDRYLPLCDMLIRGLNKYLTSHKPV
jgi:integrase